MTKVINLNKKQKTNYKSSKYNNFNKTKISIFNSDIVRILLTFIALVSILFGCIIYKKYPSEHIISMFRNYVSQIHTNTFLSIFISFIKVDLLYYTVLFFIGTSIIGIPLVFLPIAFRCILIGYLSSFMYCEYELKGVLFALVLLYPLFAVTTSSLIYSANESVYMSKYIYNTMTNKNPADNISIKLYLIRYIFLIIINFISIAVNSLLISLLASKFNLH